MVRHSGDSTVELCDLHEWKRAYCCISTHRRWYSNSIESCKTAAIIEASILHPLRHLHIWPQATDHLILKSDEVGQSFPDRARVGHLFKVGWAYRMTEEPLCEPWIFLAFLEMASCELWVRGKVEATFLAFHADDKREGRIVEKDLHGPG